jgi:transmembrane sensor
MINYTQYTVEDFVQDAYFREGVLANTPDAHRFWEAFYNENPAQKEDIDLAKSMVLGLKIKEIPVADGDIQKGIDRILALTEVVETPIVPLYQRTWFRIAASLTLLMSIGLWWSRGEVPQKSGENTVNTDGTSRDNREGVKLEEKIVNNEDKPSSITLPDGSTVVLEKNSQIRFDKDFKGTTRTVYLTGEALFDVVKNPNKPFIVYAGDLVTKVLGTSFRIKALDKAANVTVNVIRGRVSVFANKKDKQKDPEVDGLILTPNQKVEFSKVEERLKRTLIEKPVVIIPQETLQQMVFDEAPVSSILKALEKAYGVEILFDEENLKKCELTTTLKNETLFEKLTVICKSIGATYKVVDAQVIIEGDACK